MVDKVSVSWDWVLEMWLNHSGNLGLLTLHFKNKLSFYSLRWEKRLMGKEFQWKKCRVKNYVIVRTTTCGRAIDLEKRLRTMTLFLEISTKVNKNLNLTEPLGIVRKAKINTFLYHVYQVVVKNVTPARGQDFVFVLADRFST